MALPKTKTERVNNDHFLTEYEAVGLLEKEWKNIVFFGLVVILAVWFGTHGRSFYTTHRCGRGGTADWA
jgi:hypothetical protein